MSKAKIAFRADASLAIGTGHLMRCLTLAQALREAGVACHFITRLHSGHLAERIAARGFSVSCLEAASGPTPAPPPAHAAWAGVGWEQDADETRIILQGRGIDWLVLDHYAFDARWERRALAAGTKLLVIDDLADRAHAADLLLDQTLGRTATDYDGLLPPGATCLTGPQYALLRPEFAAMRAAALAERAGRELRRLLVFMGGVDAADATSSILTALRQADLPRGLALTVVMGSGAPMLAKVAGLMAQMPCPARLAVDAPDMARLMAEADLAIGAAGTATWERSCMGLPSIVVEVAHNQSAIAREIVASGSGLSPGPLSSPGFAARLRQVLAEACSPGRLQAMSEASAKICDGDGTVRLTARLADATPGFRDARLEDSRRVWEWRQAGARFNLSTAETSFPEHHAWFARAVEDPQRCFRILQRGSLPAGYVRVDRTTRGCGRVSICLSAEARGLGLSKTLLEEAERLAKRLGLVQLYAEVHSANQPSLSCFMAAGYRSGEKVGEFKTFHLTIENLGHAP